MATVVGCDVSKGWIDVHVLDPERRFRIANQVAAIDRWVAALEPIAVVGMEATGTLHELLADSLSRAGHSVYVINPRWICHYRRGIGARGKTDRGDAEAIARFVAAEAGKLHAYRIPTEQQRELRWLLLRRQQAIKLRTATRQSLGELSAGVLEEFKLVLKQIEQRIAALLAAEPELAVLAARLKSIPGIGPLTAAHLVQVLTRFSFSACGAFIAHTGMDPRPNDSGMKRGRRRLTHHGDAALRSMLFMAAMAACKSPPWRALFDAKVRAGLPTTAAFIVVARKLARIAFSLSKSGKSYDPTLLGACAPS